jgi:ribosomal protein L11 methyltransferase
VRLGDHTQIHPDEQFDMILANITRNVILETLPTLSKALLPKGTLLVSGILHADIPIIQQAAANLHLTATNEQLRGNWAMIILYQKRQQRITHCFDKLNNHLPLITYNS